MELRLDLLNYALRSVGTSRSKDDRWWPALFSSVSWGLDEGGEWQVVTIGMGAAFAVSRKWAMDFRWGQVIWSWNLTISKSDRILQCYVEYNKINQFIWFLFSTSKWFWLKFSLSYFKNVYVSWFWSHKSLLSIPHFCKIILKFHISYLFSHYTFQNKIRNHI